MSFPPVNLVDFIRYFNDTFYVFRFRRSIDFINTNEKYRVSNVFIEKRVWTHRVPRNNSESTRCKYPIGILRFDH